MSFDINYNNRIFKKTFQFIFSLFVLQFLYSVYIYYFNLLYFIPEQIISLFRRLVLDTQELVAFFKIFSHFTLCFHSIYSVYGVANIKSNDRKKESKKYKQLSNKINQKLVFSLENFNIFLTNEVLII